MTVEVHVVDEGPHQVIGRCEPRDLTLDGTADAELMLAYVAVTRAKRELDLSLVPHFLARQPRTPNAPPAVDEPPEAPTSPVEARDGCPLCGRTDVLRGGLVAAHSCVGVAR